MKIRERSMYVELVVEEYDHYIGYKVIFYCLNDSYKHNL